MSSVEIFVLNYNGNKYLDDCLGALEKLNKGGHEVGINLIDNNSSESPKEIVKKYPSVNYIQLKKNFGFSKGNNEGVRKRLKELKKQGKKEPDYLVFLNNDTIVDSRWLLAPIMDFNSFQNVGIIGSKSYFKDKFVEINFDIKNPWTEKGEKYLVVKFDYSTRNNVKEEARFRTSNACLVGDTIRVGSKSKIFIPIEDENKESASIKISVMNPNSERVEFSFYENYQKLCDTSLEKNFVSENLLSMGKVAYKEFIQNAGSVIYNDFLGRDIGNLEEDCAKYNELKKVQACCGVSMFIRTSIFKKLHGFEEKTFAYYEDTDLSFRTRLLGYDCIFEPRSKLRHVHCGTAVDNSPFLKKVVAWSNFVFNSKYAPEGQWKEIKTRYKNLYKREYKFFETDRDFEKYPYLNFMGKYVKNYFFILKNRLGHKKAKDILKL